MFLLDVNIGAAMSKGLNIILRHKFFTVFITAGLIFIQY